MTKQILYFVHFRKKVFLRYLFYAYFDVLKISIVSSESHPDQTAILHNWEIFDHLKGILSLR